MTFIGGEEVDENEAKEEKPDHGVREKCDYGQYLEFKEVFEYSIDV